MSSDNKVTPIPSFAGPPPIPAVAAPQTARMSVSAFSESMLGKLGRLLGTAVDDAASIEVTTYTNSVADSLTGQPEQMARNMRLRASTRVKLDGDTQLCVPLLDSGQPDEALWKIHSDAVRQARADRQETLAMIIGMIHKIVPGTK